MKILLTYDYGKKAVDEMVTMGYEVVLIDEKRIREGIIRNGFHEGDDLRDIDVLICYDPFDGIDLEWFPELKWIQLSSIGFDQIPDSIRDDRKITVTNNHGGYSKPIGEWIVLNLLEIYKNRKETWSNQLNKVWRLNTGVCEILGKRIGFLGTGTLAQEAAVRLAGFEVETIGFNTNGRQVHPFDQCQSMDSLDTWLPILDAVVVALPYTSDTYHLLDKRRLDLLKEDASLVNVSRGAVIDEVALNTCLAEGRFKGVALDVFESEPLTPESPLWDYERVYISSHNSWFSEKRNSRRLAMTMENLRRFKTGEGLLNVVDLARGY